MRQLMRNHGPGWLGARLAYEAQVKSGIQARRFRQRQWAENELATWLRPGIPRDAADYAIYRQEHRPHFFFQADDRPVYGRALRQILGESGQQSLIDEAQQIRQGCFRYFSASSADLGDPPAWHQNPFTGQQTSPTTHWSRVPMFSAETGDLKYIWEPGRFASAYSLSRAFWVTGDDVYAETFWQLLESWISANPPNHGAHWKCGQETSLRLMAWCFALYALADSRATTPARLALLVGAIAAQADRVAGDHFYARLQRNNHAISEGAGLWTVGILFPEFKKAEAWRELGQRILEEEAERQIYDDGSYVQHSTNYHRLMLHDYLWAIALGDANGFKLSSELKNRVRQAGQFLFQLQDEPSGRVPNYGANDGALILPLNNCDYRDFHPVLAAIHYLFDGSRLYGPGLWDEDLLWFFGPEALEQKLAHLDKNSLAAPDGGYYTLRGKNRNTWAMIRCATFRDRPSQADMLHLDIWRQGENIACDPGTYRYYAEPPWDNTLVSTAVHNTVMVDGKNQMERGPRFLWLNWLKSEVFHHLASDDGGLEYFEGAHYGYARLAQPVTHRRAVLRSGEDVWIIVDDLCGQGEHEFRVHWLLSDLSYEADRQKKRVTLITNGDRYGLSLHASSPGETAPVQFDVVRGTKDSAPHGWQSDYYGVVQPTVSVTLSLTASTPCRLISVFAPEALQERLSARGDQIRIVDNKQALVSKLLAPDSPSIMQRITLDGHNQQEVLIIV